MIPVTSYAGRTVAVFGLGGSGLASCHALKAGGAEVVAADDNPDNVAKAAQAGFVTADLRTVLPAKEVTGIIDRSTQLQRG
jgi:UDP-N-acetylmuramoylalanine--D-glutamate ligase